MAFYWLRLSLYRRASSLHDASDIESFAAELIDRFGTLPQEVAHLLAVLRIKQLCLRAGIARIDAGPKGAVLSFYQDRFVNPDALLAYLAKHPTRFKLRADQKLLLMEDLSRESNIIPAITRAVSEIAALISPALKAA